MNKWLSIEFTNKMEASKFTSHINKAIFSHSDKTYYKIFTPKIKEFKHKIFYIADEGSIVIKDLENHFPLLICKTPKRNLITRVAGFTADREWMLF